VRPLLRWYLPVGKPPATKAVVTAREVYLSFVWAEAPRGTGPVSSPFPQVTFYLSFRVCSKSCPEHATGRPAASSRY
jgi:hypothetical protein